MIIEVCHTSRFQKSRGLELYFGLEIGKSVLVLEKFKSQMLDNAVAILLEMSSPQLDFSVFPSSNPHLLDASHLTALRAEKCFLQDGLSHHWH